MQNSVILVDQTMKTEMFSRSVGVLYFVTETPSLATKSKQAMLGD